jgi:hypothetical protein
MDLTAHLGRHETVAESDLLIMSRQPAESFYIRKLPGRRDIRSPLRLRYLGGVNYL